MKDFEKNITRLEQLAEKMREPDIPLEKSFILFEEGVALARKLKDELDEMQGKVEILLNSLEDLTTGETSQPIVKEFEPSGSNRDKKSEDLEE